MELVINTGEMSRGFFERFRNDIVGWVSCKFEPVALEDFEFMINLMKAAELPLTDISLCQLSDEALSEIIMNCERRYPQELVSLADDQVEVRIKERHIEEENMKYLLSLYP